MSKIVINISFQEIINHSVLVDNLAPAYRIEPGDQVHFEIDMNSDGLIYSDWLLLITSAIDFLRNNEVEVSGTFINFNPNCNKVQYASRVNFFELLGFDYQEDFTRRNSSGRFTEIKAFDKDNANDLFEEIMKILVENNVNNDMLTVLNFCLWEVLDNTLNHSGEGFAYGAGKGQVCAQYFPNREEVRIMIADTGIGIHEALTTHPKSQYKHFSEEEAVLNCINRGVTNSEGMGFGLWATSEMIKKNQGEFIIHSGNHHLYCGNSQTIQRLSKWQGTFTYLRLNTNVPVYHQEIFGKNSHQHDMYQEFKERLFENLDQLW